MWRNRIRRYAALAEAQRGAEVAFSPKNLGAFVQASIHARPSQLVCADWHQPLYQLAFELRVPPFHRVLPNIAKG